MTTLTVNLLDSTSIEKALEVLTHFINTDILHVGVTTAPVETESNVAQAMAGAMDPEPDVSQPDANGLIWNADYCSNPPSMNADGTWRAKRGHKEAYDAAVAAVSAEPEREQPAESSAPASAPSMPTAPATPSMPAAPAPTTPPAPIEYEAMAQRFMGMMNAGTITAEQVGPIYENLNVSYDDLETNQTSISRLWTYMDAVDGGAAHAGAVQAALGIGA